MGENTFKNVLIVIIIIYFFRHKTYILLNCADDGIRFGKNIRSESKLNDYGM